MEFAAVPLAASVANVETVEMGSAVVTDATESSLSETPEAPPVPQIPRGRRLHADTVFFAPAVAVDSRGALSPLNFTLPYDWTLVDR